MLIEYTIKTRVAAGSEEQARLIVTARLHDSELDDFEITDVVELPPGVYHGVVTEVVVEGAPPSVMWEGSHNYWEATINGEQVKVTLQSRPIDKGVWADVWVWEGESLYCSDKFWNELQAAMDDAERAYNEG